MAPIPDYILMGISLVLVLSVFASKVAERFGIPALLLFLALGMLLGSEGPGDIYFDDPALAQFIGVVALALILFSGGLYTDWNGIRPVRKNGQKLTPPTAAPLRFICCLRSTASWKARGLCCEKKKWKSFPSVPKFLPD